MKEDFKELHTQVEQPCKQICLCLSTAVTCITALCVCVFNFAAYEENQ